MRNGIFSLFAGFLLCAQAGCATTDRDAPVVTAPGSAGVVYLATGRGKPAGCKKITTYRKPSRCSGVAGKMVEVKIKNDTGLKMGSLSPHLATDDLFLDAFSQGLTRAGFTVKRVIHLPLKIARGVEITRVHVDMSEESGLLTTTGACTIHIEMNVHVDGAKIKRHFEAQVTDYVFQDRDSLSATLLREALQTLMQQVVPGIAKEFEGSRQRS